MGKGVLVMEDGGIGDCRDSQNRAQKQVAILYFFSCEIGVCRQQADEQDDR